MKRRIEGCIAAALFGVLAFGCPNPVEETKKSDNADLSSLATSVGVLSPAFESSRTVYSLSVPNDISQVSITGVASEENAALSSNNGKAQGLAVGANRITIVVTAPDGKAKKEYHVLVGRWGAETISATIGPMIGVPSGRFQRNGTPGNVSAVDAFLMSLVEIPRVKFNALLGGDPSRTQYSDDDGPAIDQRWYHAIAFCNKLSLAEDLDPVYSVEGVDFSTLVYADIPMEDAAAWNAATADWSANGYRLPTEMEWMWAAMGAPADGQNGGTNTTGYLKAFAGSTGTNAIEDYAWYTVNCGNGNESSPDFKARPVGGKLPNELGLHDMSGNVWERCWDWRGTYPEGFLDNYRGAETGDRRIHRGGEWNSGAAECSIAARSSYYPGGGARGIGFRVVRNAP